MFVKPLVFITFLRCMLHVQWKSNPLYVLYEHGSCFNEMKHLRQTAMTTVFKREFYNIFVF